MAKDNSNEKQNKNNIGHEYMCKTAQPVMHRL